MHSFIPQQVRRRNFDLEQHDGSCRQSFPFVKWINSTIESMGAMNIPDKNVQLDFIISDAQIFANSKPRKPSRGPTIDGNKGRSSGMSTRQPLDSWTPRTYKLSWRKKNESESSWLSQPLPPQLPPTPNMEKDIWAKLRNRFTSNKKWRDKFWLQSKTDTNSKSWTTPF